VRDELLLLIPESLHSANAKWATHQCVREGNERICPRKAHSICLRRKGAEGFSIRKTSGRKEVSLHSTSVLDTRRTRRWRSVIEWIVLVCTIRLGRLVRGEADGTRREGRLTRGLDDDPQRSSFRELPTDLGKRWSNLSAKPALCVSKEIS
jgi:hypothetical protein